MAGSQSPTRRPRRNRANPASVPPVAPASAPPIVIVNPGAAPAAPPTPAASATSAELQAAEADLRHTMARLLGSSNAGGQIIAKRVVGAEERWLCNMGTPAWDEAAFAAKYGAGSYALYVYGPDGSPRGRIPWAVDDSIGPGQPPPGAHLPMNQPHNAQVNGGAGGMSENVLLSFVKTLTDANTALMSKLADMGKGNGGGFGFAEYIKLRELENANKPKLSDLDGVFSLGMKMAGAGNAELPVWASVLQGAIPVLEPISRALSIRLAGTRQLGAAQRPQLPGGANGQAGRTAGGAANAAPGAGPGQAPGAARGATAEIPGAEVPGGKGPAADAAGAGMTEAEAEQSLRLVISMLLRSQPPEGEEDERDPTTYANLVVDTLGLDTLEEFAGSIPVGSLADALVMQVPALRPSLAFIGRVETELREIVAEAARNDDQNPIVGKVGAPSDSPKQAAQA